MAMLCRGVGVPRPHNATPEVPVKASLRFAGQSILIQTRDPHIFHFIMPIFVRFHIDFAIIRRMARGIFPLVFLKQHRLTLYRIAV